MRVTSLGYRTDLALRALEGGTETDRGGYLVVRNPALPDFWWGNFLLLAQPPEPDSAGDWLATFTADSRKLSAWRSGWTRSAARTLIRPRSWPRA